MNYPLLHFLVGAFLVLLAAALLPGPRRNPRDTLCAAALVCGQIIMGGVAAHLVLGISLWWAWVLPASVPLVGVILGITWQAARKAVQDGQESDETLSSEDELAPSVGVNVLMRVGITPDDVLDDVRRRGPGR